MGKLLPINQKWLLWNKSEMKSKSPDSNRVSWETGWRTNGASEAAVKCVGAECHILCLTVLSHPVQSSFKVLNYRKNSMIQIHFLFPHILDQTVQVRSKRIQETCFYITGPCSLCKWCVMVEVCSFYILSGLSDLIHADLQYNRSLFGKRLPLCLVSGQCSDRGDHCEFHSSLGKTLEPWQTGFPLS